MKKQRDEEVIISNNYFLNLEFLARYYNGDINEFTKDHLNLKIESVGARKLFLILLHDINVIDNNYVKRIEATDELNGKAMVSYKKCYDELTKLYPINDYPEYYV